jgi:tetratricopeptide (TPR) repeat protein
VVAALVVALAAVRTLDAQLSWRDARTLWQRAVESNPADANAWSMYVEALDPEAAAEALDAARAHVTSPRLTLHEALLALPRDRARGEDLMREAAEQGEAKAMANLASLLAEDGRLDDALTWARRATERAPIYANGFRILGKVALAAQKPDEALAAFQYALRLEPQRAANRYNVALSLLALHRDAEARPYLESCLDDPELGQRAKAALR